MTLTEKVSHANTLDFPSVVTMEDTMSKSFVECLPDIELKCPLIVREAEEEEDNEDDDEEDEDENDDEEDNDNEEENDVFNHDAQTIRTEKQEHHNVEHKHTEKHNKLNAESPNAHSSKTKRSSSASNDVLHERDRFRARFDSFNASDHKWLISELPSADCEVCGSMRSKTTKLNVPDEQVSSTDEVTELLFRYSIAEAVLPLDSRSLFYQTHLDPVRAETEIDCIFDIRAISPPQLSSVFHWYFNRPLPPTNQMFPWLHGLHKDNFTQRSFFISQKLLQNSRESGASPAAFDVDISKPKDARSIMCVNSGAAASSEQKILRNSVGASEILRQIEYLRYEVILQVKNLVLKAFPQAEDDDEHIATLTEMIANDCFATGYVPVFLDLDPNRGVSLRNFHIQVAKLAHCADFVVYCFCKSHLLNCKCLSLARLLRVAQLCDKSLSRETFNIFMLTWANVQQSQDIFTSNEDACAPSGSEALKKTQLLLSTMRGLKTDIFSVWDSGLQVKEKIETTRMSSATQLHMNVWLGNIWDYQIMMHHWRLQAGDTDEDYETQITPLDNPRHLYYDPAHSCLVKDNLPGDAELISLLTMPRAHWKLFVHCHNDASFPSPTVLSDLLFKYTITSHKAEDVDEIHHLEFPSAGSIGFGDCKQESLMSIVNTCKLLYLYSSSVGPDSLASLIYCSDGYTELSFLSLCYIMYAENVSLEDAMLKLHLDYGRPFYIFNSDVSVLQKLEVLLRRFSPLVLTDIKWAAYETTSSRTINEILLGKRSNTPKAIPKKLRLGYIAENSDSESSLDSSGDEDDMNETSSFLNRSWVEEVEGSFPSRILPYLYLGSLKHANSLTLLTKLGIKKVISVGEELDWLNGHKFQHNNNIIVDEIDNGDIEVFNISPKPTSHNKFSTHSSVDGVMKVNNLQDDGIDELTKALPKVLDQIDQEYRRTNGNTKILVHCRVGVSRSATVVIAEVMRRLGLNLPQAYLYVRVRRLNIVIQPNLRFMYELFKWEEKERSRGKDTHSCCVLREIDWFVMCREIRKLNSPFLQR